jgi:hypothetical protein
VSISATTTFRAIAYMSGMVDSSVSSATYTLATAGGGLQGDYYTGTNFQTLSLSRTDPTVNFSWAGSPGTGVPADNFSVRWTGFVTAQSSETYTFTTRSDDGVRLWVNGQQLVNNWTYHGSTDNSGQIALVAGQSYSIVMEFFEGTELAVAQLSWATPTIAKQIVPQSQLSPTAPGPAPVANPTFSPTPGNFSSPMSVTIASATAGASIRYTTDGSTPTSSVGTLYAGPVSISANDGLQGYRLQSGMTDSAVTSATYTSCRPRRSPIRPSAGAGDLLESDVRDDFFDNSRASIRYTTDGSSPTSSVGTLYAGPVSISADNGLQGHRLQERHDRDRAPVYSAIAYTLRASPRVVARIPPVSRRGAPRAT